MRVVVVVAQIILMYTQVVLEVLVEEEEVEETLVQDKLVETQGPLTLAGVEAEEVE
jgi:hypothetical protein